MTHPIARGNSDPYVSAEIFRARGGRRCLGRGGGRVDGGATMRASAREEFPDHDPLRKRMCAEERGRMGCLASTDPYYKSVPAESPWLFRGRYSPRYDFAV